MKRLRKCLLIAVFCLAAAMLVQPVKAQAKNPSKVVLKVGKTYKKYDVTGDKKKDRYDKESGIKERNYIICQWKENES